MFEVDGGVVWHAGAGRHGTTVKRARVCSVGDEMALAYDADTGVAHKLGTRADINAWGERSGSATAFAASFGQEGGPAPGPRH